MFTKLNQKKIVKLAISTVLMIQLLCVISFGQSNISQEISKFSNKENLTISDFKEFAKDQENKGYKLYILDLQEGFTSPKLIADENINQVKELIGKESNISSETVNENNYPELFNQYDVEFLTCKDKRGFIFFIESSVVNLVVKPSGDNIEVSVDGKSPVKTANGSIPLKKGNIYNITVYKDGNEKLAKDVDLTNYEKDVYELKVGGSIIPLMGVIVGVILVVLVFIKNKHKTETKSTRTVPTSKPIKEHQNIKVSRSKVNTPPVSPIPPETTNYIRIGGNITSTNELLANEKYEDVLQVQTINKLETHLHTTKSRLDVVRNNSFDILNNSNNIDSSFRKDINEIKGESDEINSSLGKIQVDIDKLKRSIEEIKQYSDAKKVIKIEASVQTAKDIFIILEDCYLRLDEIKSQQYYIQAAMSTSIVEREGMVYTKQSYIDIVNSNAEVLSKLIEHVIKRDNQMNDFKDLIETEMKNMSKSIDNVYSKMEKEVSRICKSVQENNTNMKDALNNFDSNIIKTLNTKINSVNKQLQSINSNPSDTLQKSLITELYKAVDTKLDTLEEIVPTLVEKVTSQYSNINDLALCNEYEHRLDEASLGYLRTAECLYYINTNDKSMKLYDYSSVYIMYSKLLEAELAKCVDQRYLSKPSNRSLGSMSEWLRKNKSSTWGNFNDYLEKEQIRILRNHAAHNELSGNGIVEMKHVEQIRNFLFNKSKTNSGMCWLDFILKQQRQKIGGVN